MTKRIIAILVSIFYRKGNDEDSEKQGTSGSIYSEFINEFKKNINEIRIAPRIIIFTSNKSNYINKSSSILPINHTFYNAGGVVDYFGPVKEFILSKKSYQNNIIEQSIFQREKIDKFNFEYISDKNQLL